MSRLKDIEAMLERQAKAWDLRCRADERGRAQDLEPRPAQGPWITVSSPVGSGGRELARELAREPGWQVFDHEIVKTIAEHTHTQEALLAHLDEHAMGPINDYLARLFDPRIPGQEPFHKETVRVIWGLARRGHAVILGRGGNWILEPRHGIRLRAVAPIELRAERIARDEKVDLVRAREIAVTADARQADFIRRVFHREIDDPVGYDLVLNLGYMSPETASKVALTCLRQRLEIG